jgi:hypothetical protein
MLRLRILGYLVVLAAAAPGCGGMVVFEEEGAGGSGAGGTTTGPAGSSGQTGGKSTAVTATAVTTGTGGTCEGLLAAMEAANEKARFCSNLKPVIQCNGSVILLDTCGCPTIIANENNVGDYQAAQQAYNDWVSAGCGPYPCEVCNPVMGGGICSGPGEEGLCTPHD